MNLKATRNMFQNGPGTHFCVPKIKENCFYIKNISIILKLSIEVLSLLVFFFAMQF